MLFNNLVSLFFFITILIIIRGLSGPPSIMGPYNPDPLPPLFGAPGWRQGDGVELLEKPGWSSSEAEKLPDEVLQPVAVPDQETRAEIVLRRFTVEVCRTTKHQTQMSFLYVPSLRWFSTSGGRSAVLSCGRHKNVLFCSLLFWQTFIVWILRVVCPRCVVRRRSTEGILLTR